MQNKRYPGVRPFEIADKDLFFGRERDLQDLSVLIALEKLVVLFGKSGNGKSSLINAGIIPTITSSIDFYETQFVPIVIRLGSYIEGTSVTPFETLLTRLNEKVADYEGSEFLQSYFTELTLWYHFKRKSGNLSRFLIIFDQFEEFFTYPLLQQDNFKSQLAELLRPDLPQLLRESVKSFTKDQRLILAQELEVKVLFSIRSDRMSLLDQMKDKLPAILHKRFELKGLRKEQAREAIEKPAQKLGDFISPIFSYDPEALNYILQKLSAGEYHSSSDIEAFQLQILCEYIEEKVINGEVSKNIVEKFHIEPNFDTIFSNYYNKKIEKIGNFTLQYTARKLLEEVFILEDKKTGLALRQSFSKEYIVNLNNKDMRFFGLNITDSLLDTLVDIFILRRELSSSERIVYEISHDTLLYSILSSKDETKKIKDLYEKERHLEFKRNKELIQQNKGLIDEKNTDKLRPINRYPGLKPFDSFSSSIFFGRDETIAELLASVLMNNLTVIFGKSGYGKSSLINAGLVPYLKNLNDGDIQYHPIIIRLGTFNPFNSKKITTRVSNVIDNHIPIEEKTNILTNIFDPNVSLVNYFLGIRNKHNKKFILIFDQFEEFFSYPIDSRTEFTGEIASVLFEQNIEYKNLDFQELAQEQRNQLFERLNLSVIIAIRSDRLHLLDSMGIGIPSILHNRFELKGLRVNEALNAIVEPASLKGNFQTPNYKFSDQALDIILKSLSRGVDNFDIEPFQLQILCEYFESEIRKGNILSNIILPEHLNHFDKIYLDYYERILNNFSTDEKRIVQYIIEESLIYVDRANGSARRLSIDTDALLHQNENIGLHRELLDKIENSHLIRRDSNSFGGFNYEVSHDVLLPSILESKSKRMLIEGQIKREEEAKSANYELSREKRRRKRASFLALIALLLVFLSVASSIFAFQSMQRTEMAKKQTQMALYQYQKAEQERQAAEFKRLLAEIELYISVEEFRLAKDRINKAMELDPTNLMLRKFEDIVTKNQIDK